MSTTTFLIIVGAQYVLSHFFHTSYLHRYVTHEMYMMGEKTEKVFFFLTWFFQGPAFLDDITYAKMHLEHHAHSDQKGDPHSPLNFSKWKWGLDFPVAASKMMWHTKKLFVEIKEGRNTISKMYSEKRFLNWTEFRNFTRSYTSMLGWGAIYIMFYVLFAPNPWYWLILPINLLAGPIQGAIVNWCGHMWGFRRYNTPDNSRNTPGLNLISFGETNQNNHHKFPKMINFAKSIWEIDLAYPILRILHWCKVIYIPDQSGYK